MSLDLILFNITLCLLSLAILEGGRILNTSTPPYINLLDDQQNNARDNKINFAVVTI